MPVMARIMSFCWKSFCFLMHERNVRSIIIDLKIFFVSPFSLDLAKSLVQSCFWLPRTTLRNTFFERLNNGPEEKELFFDPIKRIEWKNKSKDAAVQQWRGGSEAAWGAPAPPLQS